VPLNHGDFRPHLNEAVRKVIRTANADWVASGLHTGVRYELVGRSGIEDQYLIFDNHFRSFISLTALYDQLPVNRQQATGWKHSRR